MLTTTNYVHVPGSHETLLDGPIGAILLLGSETSGDWFSLVEHPIAARALGAPVHTHRNEDEYSFVLEGAIGVEIAGEAFDVSAGSVVVKPRGIPHAFWNPTHEPARLLELIVPGGFERYFAELGEILGRPGPPDLDALLAVATRYGLDLEPDSIPRLAAEHDLRLG